MKALTLPRLLPQSTRLGPADLPYWQPATPADVLDLRYLESNLTFLADLSEQLDVRILLAQKAFSLPAAYPLIGRYLAGTTASGLYEARLAQEAMPGGEIHVFSPAYKEAELRELCDYADHLIFNSPAEWRRWRDLVRGAARRRPPERPLELGLRLNPEYAEVAEAIYNPAAPGSRLGITERELRQVLAAEPDFLDGISGFHLHALCEEGAETLSRMLEAALQHFGDLFAGARWLNLGGGHLLTRAGYQTSVLAASLDHLRAVAGQDLRLYLEPGEAVALDCGWLITTVEDTSFNELHLAILDASAACHMPDVLEMPYQPRCFRVQGDGQMEAARPLGQNTSLSELQDRLRETAADLEKPSPETVALDAGPDSDLSTAAASASAVDDPRIWRLGGRTCLAGDVTGDYAFSSPLQPGDRLVFADMAIYAHVKRNHFNGMPLPDLYTWDGRELCCLRHFTYADFRSMLGKGTAGSCAF